MSARIPILTRALFLAPLALATPLSAQEAYEPKPIPAGPDVFTSRAYWSQHTEFLLQAYMSAHEAGESDPAWAEKARSLIKDHVHYLVYWRSMPSDSKSDLLDRANEVLELGCEDPVILAIAGNLNFLCSRTRRGLPQSEKALEQLKQRKDSPYLAYLTSFELGAMYEGAKLDDQSAKHANTKRELLIRAAADPLVRKGNQRVYVGQLMDNWRHGNALPEDADVFLAALRKQPDVDPWILLMCEGMYAKRRGWLARSDEYADQVTEKGWKIFHEQQAKAAQALMAAHELHPEYPEAACVLIGISGSTGEYGDPRKWFDATVAAQFDYLEAYKTLVWYSMPRWGGSHGRILRLARELVATGRFDTKVPGLAFDAMRTIAMDYENWREPYRRLSARKLMDAYFEGVLKAVDGEEAVRQKCYQVVVLWAAKRFKEAAPILEELGDEFDRGACAYFRVRKDMVEYEIRDATRNKAPKGK